MTRHTLVTAIIPTYNMAVCIRDAIRSALDQTYPDIEVLVVDDGSTDETAAVVAEFGDRVTYIKQANAGQGAARNLAIRRSKGEFVAFLDADDIWRPTKIERQMALAAEAGVSIVGCGYTVQDMTGQIEFDRVVRRNFDDRQTFVDLMSICQLLPGSGSGVLAAKACFERVGYFDEALRFAQDWDMWLRLVQQYEARFVEDVLVVIRKNNLKPAFRTQSNEQRFVSMVIDKNVAPTQRPRSYAALHARLGSNSLALGDFRTAAQHLATSIRLQSTRIFPRDPGGRYRLPNVPRYYLLAKSLLGILTRKSQHPDGAPSRS